MVGIDAESLSGSGSGRSLKGESEKDKDITGTSNENENGNGTGTGNGNAGEERRLNETELDELWSWAPLEANREARRRNWGGDYTLEEKEIGVENVVTGLKRQLEVNDEDEDDDEEEEDDEAEGVIGVGGGGGGGGLGMRAGAQFQGGLGSAGAVPGAVADLGLNDILRFTTTGTVQHGRPR